MDKFYKVFNICAGTLTFGHDKVRVLVGDHCPADASAFKAKPVDKGACGEIRYARFFTGAQNDRTQVL